jgi:GrpB-like predicted nucleotidyltransferase (UPF0157 family)
MTDATTFPNDAMEQPAIKILPYESRPPSCERYDSRAAQAAAVLVDYVQCNVNGATVEHIGSTAVPDCAGKGIIDLMVVCQPGKLESVREQVDALGFQRQTTPDPFPEERPMRTGAFEHEGRQYWVHVHIIPADSQEVEDVRYFRDCLRADSELRSAYVAFKKKLLAKGVADSTDYSIAKGEFVRQCLGR